MKNREAFFHLHMISDATGETLITVARAAAAQYEIRPIEHVHSMVRTAKQLERVIAALEEMQELSDLLSTSRAAGGERGPRATWRLQARDRNPACFRAGRRGRPPAIGPKQRSREISRTPPVWSQTNRRLVLRATSPGAIMVQR